MTTSKAKRKRKTKNPTDWASLPYFSYGSNLNLQQMEQRCRTATNLGAAELPNWLLTFRGVADVVPAERGRVYGGLFKIDAACLKALDRYEGWPYLYVHKKIKVIDQNGDLIDAFMYVMNEKRGREISMPGDWYFNVIKEGFADFHLPERPLFEALKEVASESERPVRIEAGYYCDTPTDDDEAEYQEEMALAF